MGRDVEREIHNIYVRGYKRGFQEGFAKAVELTIKAFEDKQTGLSVIINRDEYLAEQIKKLDTEFEKRLKEEEKNER